MNVQVIMQDGRPAFAVMPFAQYEQLLKKAEMTENQADKLTFPQEVIDYKYDNNCSFIKAWRVYLKKTQKEVAASLGITQGAYSQIENAESNQKSTLEKVSKALGLEIGQLTLVD
ncbi:MAG TPA: helix-turn-helix transcriptional regulator [Lentisphaeria bacterium]|nr:helix-turn-helix transcriptional regulator [Lentisphaerota bacterium]OQC17472.1 MAG: helix-turn-helix protein [Lentisphaerae bacterium ADurb.Bin082]HPY90371.1 helix-turn-helix transcriptional regulator [Lentisphaeria bacterium]HQL87987.1 helix-turn-helix transcriptional regulator [Lentisphaeria bacterium]